MLETAENLRARVRHRARGAGPRWRCARTSAPSPRIEDGRFADEIVPVAVPHAAGRADRGRPRRAPARRHARWSRWPRCGRSWPARTPRRPSRPATPAARTTPRPPAWSPRPSWRSELGLDPLGRLVSWAVAGVEPRLMGIGPVPGHRAGAGTGRPDARRARPDRAERGVRLPGPGLHPRVGLRRRRASSGSTSTARGSRSVTRSAPPAAASSRPCCARCVAAARATAWRRCASAAARGWPRSSPPSRSGRARRRSRRLSRRPSPPG